MNFNKLINEICSLNSNQKGIGLKMHKQKLLTNLWLIATSVFKLILLI